MKPHIKPTAYKGWCCKGGGISCHGDSPLSAYNEWHHMYSLIQNRYRSERQ